MQREVPCVIFRGGTSKAVFFQEEVLPVSGQERDSLLLKVMGSPDLRQIDGLGGATSTTSKVAIISVSDREDADVNYTFAQVAIDKPVVDYKGNCGNISSAVGPYAIEMGLVEASDGETVVRIFNTNTNKVIYSQVKTPHGQVSYDGEFAIAGVPGTSAPVILKFKKPGGSVTGKLLPTGNPTDTLEIPGHGPIAVSIVDASNPLVFVRAEDIGLTGCELPDEIDGSQERLGLLETIRGMAAEKLGFVEDWREASLKSPAVPKMTVVSRPKTCRTASGNILNEQEMDLLGRMMSMQKTHKTYALTGALCTVAASVIKGTVVNTVLDPGFDSRNLRIAHPGGIMQVGVETVENQQGEVEVLWAWGYRTARLILKGIVYYN